MRRSEDTDRRLDGEFHYAREVRWKPTGRISWVVFRMDDDRVLPSANLPNELAAQLRVNHLDHQARHFMQLANRGKA